jgi:hypothetical protein
MSSEPIHVLAEQAGTEQTSRLGIFSVFGGIVGATGAILLTVVTSEEVGLVTGGMPIVTPWAFGIIVFELTALGAILATLGRMIFEAGLIKDGRSLSDHSEEVSDGKIVLVVEGADAERRALAEQLLGPSDPSNT